MCLWTLWTCTCSLVTRYRLKRTHCDMQRWRISDANFAVRVKSNGVMYPAAIPVRLYLEVTIWAVFLMSCIAVGHYQTMIFRTIFLFEKMRTGKTFFFFILIIYGARIQKHLVTGKKETVQLPFITHTTPHRLPPERRDNKDFISIHQLLIILYALRTFRQVRGHMGLLRGKP